MMQHAIYLAHASLASTSSHEIVPRDNTATRRKLSSTSSWSSVLAFICPRHLKHCPHHNEWQKSRTGAEEQASDGGADSSSTSTSSASSTSENTTRTSSSSTSSATASDSSTSGASDSSTSGASGSSTSGASGSSTSGASGSSTSGTSVSTSSTSSGATDDTTEDESSTVTDDNVLEEENNATKGVVNGFDFGFLYIVGAALFVGGLAMIVVQRRNRSASNIEGSKTGLIDISDDPESAFVAMEMAGADNNNTTSNISAISSDIYSDINDVVVEYGVKM